MDLKVLLMDNKQENILLFNNPKTELLHPIEGCIFTNEMPFVATKRILKTDFGLEPEQFDIHFVRHETVIKASSVATNDYIVLVVLREEYEFPTTYTWTPITDNRIIYNTDGFGKMYTYLQEGIRLLCK